MAIGVKLFGDWAKAGKVVETMGAKWKAATNQAVMREAHFLRGLMIRNITSGGNLADRPFAPLSPNTLIIRKFKGFGGSKPLMVTGAMRNSIAVVKRGNGVFVGIRRAARGGVNIAEVHEFGAGPFTVVMTQKQRRFLAAAFRSAGKQFGSGGGGRGGGVIVIRIPARPFIGPVVDKYAKPEAVKKRFWDFVSKAMGYDLGKM